MAFLKGRDGHTGSFRATGPSSSPLSQESGKVKEEHGAKEGRVGKRWLPVPGLTLELRSSRRLPALLLRNLMDGDRSRFLSRLVMVDPSTAVMMRSPWTVPGTVLGCASTAALPVHATGSSGVPSHWPERAGGHLTVCRAASAALTSALLFTLTLPPSNPARLLTASGRTGPCLPEASEPEDGRALRGPVPGGWSGPRQFPTVPMAIAVFAGARRRRGHRNPSGAREPAPAAAGHSAPRGSLWPGNRSATGASHPHPAPREPDPGAPDLPLSPPLGAPAARQRPRSDPASPALGPGARDAHSALSHRARRFQLRGRSGSSSYGGTSGSKREVPPRPSYRLGRRSGGERVRPVAEGVPGVTNKVWGAGPTGGPRKPGTWDSGTTDSARRSRGYPS